MRSGSLVLVALTVFAWTACGSDYEESPVRRAPRPGPGERGGDCYPNGTCNESLTCADGRCVLLDAGEPSVPDGGDVEDASPDAMPARPLDDCPGGATAIPAGRVQCAGANATCVAASYCCEQTAGAQSDWRCEPDTNACPNRKLECDSSDDCGAGLLCCLEIDEPDVQRCPRLVLRGGACKATCGTARRTCAAEADCAPGGACVNVPALIAGTDHEVGVRVCK